MTSLAVTVALVVAIVPCRSNAAGTNQPPVVLPIQQVQRNKTSFWAIADVPYSVGDRNILVSQLLGLGSNVDFLIHLGDIKAGHSACNKTVIDQMDEVLKLSPVPVFIVVGDNEFNDCKTIVPARALVLWRNVFVPYNRKYWTRDFQAKRMPNRQEVFAFVNKRTLFIGLNLVGGLVHNQSEWNSRHADQLAWVKALMLKQKSLVHSVVLFGHADPDGSHSSFINPFVTFLRREFPTNIPVLYLGGHAHKWGYEPKYRNVTNWLRVRLTGGVKEPIVKITVDPDGLGTHPTEAFNVQRFLPI
jgi:Calcineurin-like phosphoesterase